MSEILAQHLNLLLAQIPFYPKLSLIEDKFSIVHYNVQSIANKLDLIESELRSFDVICITESWLDGRTSDENINIEDFKLFRRDRPGDYHGGICVYVRSNIFFQEKK